MLIVWPPTKYFRRVQETTTAGNNQWQLLMHQTINDQWLPMLESKRQLKQVISLKWPRMRVDTFITISIYILICVSSINLKLAGNLAAFLDDQFRRKGCQITSQGSMLVYAMNYNYPCLKVKSNWQMKQLISKATKNIC